MEKVSVRFISDVIDGDEVVFSAGDTAVMLGVMLDARGVPCGATVDGNGEVRLVPTGIFRVLGCGKPNVVNMING
jgi:hypothetical protein